MMETAISKPMQKQDRLGGASLDFLRYGAALFILIFHFGDTAPTKLAHVSLLFQQGWLATDFFLMLSGFVLMRAYGKGFAEGRAHAKSFMIKRFLRLWPSHVIILFLLAAVFLLTQSLGIGLNHPDRYRWDKFWASVFMVHGWGFFDHPGWNVPTWSISALLLAYAAFTGLAKQIYRLKGWGLVALFFAILAFGVIGAPLIFHLPLVDLPFRYGLFRVLVLFFMGATLERFVSISAVRIEIAASHFWIISLTALAFIIGIGLMPRHVITDICVLLLWGIIFYAAAISRLKETPLSKRIGRVSYAQFVTQSLVGATYYGLLNKLEKTVGLSDGLHWMLWLLGIVLAIIFAFVFEAFVDYPMSRWIKQKLSKVTGDKTD